MTPEVQAFASGFPLTLLHAGVSLLMLILGAVVYALLSPYKEITLIREGNPAASLSFGAVLLGLAIPLAVSLSASPTVLEVVVWGLAVGAVQLLMFRLTDLLLRGLPDRIRDGEVGAAGLLAAARLSTALLLAAAVAG